MKSPNSRGIKIKTITLIRMTLSKKEEKKFEKDNEEEEKGQ